MRKCHGSLPWENTRTYNYYTYTSIYYYSIPHSGLVAHRAPCQKSQRIPNLTSFEITNKVFGGLPHHGMSPAAAGSNAKHAKCDDVSLTSWTARAGFLVVELWCAFDGRVSHVWGALAIYRHSATGEMAAKGPKDYRYSRICHEKWSCIFFFSVLVVIDSVVSKSKGMLRRKDMYTDDWCFMSTWPFSVFRWAFFGVYRRLRGLTIWVRRIACRVYLIACCVECVCVCMYVCVWRGE